MAGELFGLSHRPFDESADPRFYYAAAAHERALKTLGKMIDEGQGAVLLVGAAGSGKTLMCRKLLTNVKATAIPILGTCAPRTSPGLISGLCSALNIEMPADLDLHQRCQGLKERLIRKTSPQRPVVTLVLDQIENLTETEIQELETLCELHGEDRQLLQIVLSGRSEAATRLAHRSLDRLQRQLGSTILLDPLTREEIGPYISHRLGVAGYDGPELFDGQAVTLIGKHSRGNPGSVNRICAAAMQAAQSQNRSKIDAALIEALDLGALWPESEEIHPWTAPAATADEFAAPGRRLVEPVQPAECSADEKRARQIEQRVEEACARAESVATRLEEALTLGARLGAETDRHAGILDETIQQAATLRDELTGIGDLTATGSERTDVSAELAEQTQTAQRLLEQIKQADQDAADRQTAAQNSAKAIFDERQDTLSSLFKEMGDMKLEVEKIAGEAESRLLQRMRQADLDIVDRVSASHNSAQAAMGEHHESVAKLIQQIDGAKARAQRSASDAAGAAIERIRQAGDDVGDELIATQNSAKAILDERRREVQALVEQLRSAEAQAKRTAEQLAEDSEASLSEPAGALMERFNESAESLRQQTNKAQTLTNELQALTGSADQSRNSVEQLDQRVHNVLEGADRRVDEIHDLCRQVDTVSQMLKLEKGT
ncbi:MAG: AAA family ATPase, partial [Phycisphaerae bacterium]